MRVRLALLTVVLAAGCSSEGCGTRGGGASPSRVDPADLPSRSTVYLGRELPAESKEDGPLSRLSQATALGLPQELDLKALDAVYVSDSERSKETARVVTMVRGIEAQALETGSSGAVRDVLDEHRGGTILIVAPARDLAQIGETAGLKRPLRFGAADYGELVVLRIDGSKVKVKRRPFGKTLRDKVQDGRFPGPPAQDETGGSGSESGDGSGEGSGDGSPAGESSPATGSGPPK